MASQAIDIIRTQSDDPAQRHPRLSSQTDELESEIIHPTFDAEGLRRSALSHLKSYRAADPQEKRKIFQGILMTNLHGLLRGINNLESLLRRGRFRRWLVNGILAALWNGILMNWIPFPRSDIGRKQLSQHNYLLTMAYLVTLPLFGFPLLNYEKQLSCTLTVKQEVTDLDILVRNGATLKNYDALIFTDPLWDAVPWSKVEGYS